jgi:hypothetical protein
VATRGFGESENRSGDRRSALPNKRWNGIERRNSDGRRVCPAHDQIVSDHKETVQWRVFVFVMMAGIAIVVAGFGWFGNDILKVKDAQLLIIKTTAEQTDKNTTAMTAMQKEIMNNVAENQRETRSQVERIAGQLENVSKIQQVVLNEISYLKRYDELDRVNKDRLKR